MTFRACVLARTWFGVNAVVALTALVMQTVITAGATTGHFHTPAGRIGNLFCFFTIDSNIVVAVVSALLAVRLDRESTIFRVFRLVGLVCIVVTGVVFHLVLADQQDLRGWSFVADLLLHTVVPILYPVGWLLFGPRGAVSPRIVGLAVLPPIAWLVFTFIRGPIVHWYPYPFLDVLANGYVSSLVNCAFVALLLLALAAATIPLDRRLPTPG